MDAIYSCAALTIAASSGRHADCGLPGISSPRKYKQYSERVNGLHLATMFPTFSELENWNGLAWNTRGWTLQEKLLSKRILFFTDFQVYFKCSESIWTEAVRMETGRLSKSIQSRPNKFRWVADREPHAVDQFTVTISSLFLDTKDKEPELGFLPNYTELIEQYTKRSLSDPRDTLFAIEGVLRTFGCPLFSGLPQNYFHKALLWRYHEMPHLETMAPNIPSWSWASSSSPKFWDKIDIIGTTSGLSRAKLASLVMDKRLKSEIYKYLWPVDRMLYYSDGHTQKVMVGSSIHPLRVPIPNEWVNADICPLLRSTPGLLMDAVIVRLRIGEAINKAHGGFATHYNIVDRLHRCCGEIWTTHNIAKGGREEEQDLLTLSWGESLRYAKISSEYIPKVRRSDGDSGTTIEEQSRSEWIVANVLLISYSGLIARRVGIGKVVLTGWIKGDLRKASVLLL
jgi:hypothetical protein